ncbi:chymotrypsin family serine protease [Crenalkalicoccus roseus]|uniref:hypothetical protein n=1 Tax=Crenalkalicoccus roseus TaxID=1485588 RepID=UPI001081531B|nr:hypothetical protein [Crenalkalicoccus roseus]
MPSGTNDDRSGRFETPGGGGGAERPGAEPPAQGERFEAPDADAASAQAEADDAALREALSGVDGDLLALRDEIEKTLLAATGEEVPAQAAEAEGIVGVGIGFPDAEALASGLATNLELGKAALTLYTVEPMAAERLQARVARSAGTRALSEVPVQQIPCGVIDAQPHRMRLRPAPGGISVGHHAITAGTLGCLATGLSPPTSSRLLILSNNHVLANSNAGKYGDCICQPGPFDGGRCPADQVAILHSWVPISFGGAANYVDCATGWAWPDRVRRELMYLSGGTVRYFRVGATPLAPALGMIVGKSGRTTQLTQGRVTDIAASINVNFGGGRVALFRDQIGIRSTGSGNFSAGGDSGSLIWRWSTQREPVGLLFAGGGGMTFANKIGRVLSALRIRLYT